MIRFEQAAFYYEKTRILEDLSFHIGKGDFTAVVGANGAGKTTMAKLCGGLLKPTKGRVLVNGADSKVGKASNLASFIGFVFQNPDRQICQNTIRDEILFGLEQIFPDAEARERQCQRILAKFSLPKDRDPFSMSRGERQRVALASIIAREPELLILDEPTTGLDRRESGIMMEYIRSLNEAGTTVFMISHDVELVLQYAKTVLVLNNGRMIGAGDAKEVMFDRTMLQAASVLPPQIPSLSMALGDGFRSVSTVDGMAGAIVKRYGDIREKRCVG